MRRRLENIKITLKDEDGKETEFIFRPISGIEYLRIITDAKKESESDSVEEMAMVINDIILEDYIVNHSIRPKIGEAGSRGEYTIDMFDPLELQQIANELIKPVVMGVNAEIERTAEGDISFPTGAKTIKRDSGDSTDDK